MSRPGSKYAWQADYAPCAVCGVLVRGSHAPEQCERWPVTVVLTRIAPLGLDAEDNLTAGLKAVRDQVATELGVDDRDPRVRWVYQQERAGVRQHGARVEIQEAAPHPDELLAAFGLAAAGRE